MERELITGGANDLAPAPTYAQHRAGKQQLVQVSDSERWLSAISGGALATYGFRRGSWLGSALVLVGSVLSWRGITGRSTLYRALNKRGPQNNAFDVRQSVTINKPAAELYAFWRNFENLPRFMDHLEAVSTLDQRRSHWVAKAPAGTTVAWDAEIISEQPDQYIEWRSLPGADVDNAGSVRFVAAPADRGTEVHVTIGYNPPAGPLGALVAKLFGEEPNQQVADDLRRFKRLMETGEIATTNGQPHGTRSAIGKLLSPNN